MRTPRLRPTKQIWIKHACARIPEAECGGWELDTVPAMWPASLLYADALRQVPCTGCIARGYAAATVRHMLRDLDRDLFAKRAPPANAAPDAARWPRRIA